MAQTSTYQDAQETVDKEGVEELILDFLLLIKTMYEEVGQGKANEPHETIPANGKRTQTESHQIRIPDNITK